MNGTASAVPDQKSDVDQHVAVQFPVGSGENTLRIRLRNDFGLSLSPAAAFGKRKPGIARAVRVLDACARRLTLEVAGAQGRQYEIGMWNPAQVASVEGAELSNEGQCRKRQNQRHNSGEYIRTLSS